MITIDQVSKRYGAHTVVDNISLTIPDGGVTCLIGPNGAGKSTLLGLTARLDTPASGTISINGNNVHTLRSQEVAKRLAILRQENHLNVRLTVHELIMMGRYPHSAGRPRAHDRAVVAETITQLGLDDIADRDINTLSGGQRQRAFIGMTLAQATDHLLLDEPLNNLDLRHGRQMMRLLRTIADDLSRTVVVVIHDINTAARYADRIVAMKAGRLIAHGTPEEVVTEHVLSDVFETPVRVTEMDGKPLALTY
ncbi:ABC transporter ATP-binding protein [Stomatohabitans albus]|uniref:iron ABC transporter ATP-binding protein n=1 Tax=Stomatohabitans albus TaxID=3110766 RepID=UPI00300C5E89